MKYKAFIFDLDGVICHTDEYHYLAWKKIADSINVYFDREINNRLRGVNRMASLEIILEKYNGSFTEDEKAKLAEEKNEIYKEMLKNMSPEDLSSSVKDTLDELRKRGLKLAIGSSSKNAKFILKQIGLEGYFDEISDGTNITKSKPDPEVFLMAAQYLGFSPEECLVIEDAEAGIEAAFRGGFDSAGIGEAKNCKKTTYRLDAFSDLLSIAN